jgi:hypothetical protein
MFEFQHHPNVEVVAVSDLIPERCDGLAKAVGCDKKYPSLEELVKRFSSTVNTWSRPFPRFLAHSRTLTSCSRR